jgi:hypothetical protein
MTKSFAIDSDNSLERFFIFFQDLSFLQHGLFTHSSFLIGLNVDNDRSRPKHASTASNTYVRLTIACTRRLSSTKEQTGKAQREEIHVVTVFVCNLDCGCFLAATAAKENWGKQKIKQAAS